jgi:hypothetical protein
MGHLPAAVVADEGWEVAIERVNLFLGLNNGRLRNVAGRNGG